MVFYQLIQILFLEENLQLIGMISAVVEWFSLCEELYIVR